MRTLSRGALTAALLLTGTAALAADPCTQFKWDVSHETTLFRGTPAATLEAGAAAARAPALEVNTLYALTLKPQEDVRLVIPPSKKTLDDGAYAGLLTLTVPVTGQYRIAVDAGFWLDVARDGQPLQSLDFSGVNGCLTPRKIVLYQLPAGVPVTVQLNGADTAQARITVTPVVASPR